MDKRAAAIYALVATIIGLSALGSYWYPGTSGYVRELIKAYGYIGLGIAVFLTNLTLFVGIPTPAYVALAVGVGMNPWLVTLVAAIASALGESSGYVVGLGGYITLAKKYGDWVQRWKELFEKYGFITVVIIAALPFPPDDVAGLLAGSFKYPYWKFLIATAIGKAIKYGVTAGLVSEGIKLLS